MIDKLLNGKNCNDHRCENKTRNRKLKEPKNMKLKVTHDNFIN